MNYQLEREQYARIYGCTPRSVGNYQADDAPLDEPERMYHWLWNRRTQPAGFTGKTLAEIVSDYETESDEELTVWRELSDYLADIDQRRMWMVMWLDGHQATGKPELPLGVDGRLRAVSKAILDALGTIDDLPSGYPDLDAEAEEERRQRDEATPAENIISMRVA